AMVASADPDDPLQRQSAGSSGCGVPGGRRGHARLTGEGMAILESELACAAEAQETPSREDLRPVLSGCSDVGAIRRALDPHHSQEPADRLPDVQRAA